MKMQKKKKTKKRSDLTTVFLVLILLTGLSLLCYPPVSSWWNARIQSKAVASYDAAVAGMSQKDYAEYFAAAGKYNAAVAELGSKITLSDPKRVEGYEEVLSVGDTGIMGYVTIEKINVELPIYHGTGSDALSSGAGHLEGSSLPIGGESTHSVISAHRGLPSTTLFTHLDRLEKGDTFTITVLNRILTYEVDKISIVLPAAVSDLYIEEGKDYCTLLTCTPYSVNTHRLLVRGHRIDTDNSMHIRIMADAYKIDSVIAAPILAIPMLAAMLVWLLVSTRKATKKHRRKQEDHDLHKKGGISREEN
ncbi:MAG: class C sortase [Clostridiales bacterium]|nr:class C sortase [Clostridiales bacterium]